MSDESLEPVKRLFFALNCAAPQRRAIAQWRSALQLRSGRPVPAENFHLTLMFLGAVGVAQISDICTAAANVRVPGVPLRVVLDRLDVWRKHGVMVLASEQASPELLRLVYALEQAMLPFGFEDSPKEFRPHLTLMRDYRLPVPESTEPPEFVLRAEHFTLFESHKGRYRALAEWPLAP
ncbi:RNA 2',3'-cyclic phosphodiesterase [Pseudomonas sp. 10S4]|uniref:RNA 2',3'-cyclic phosphodiesterase n=1 Tax=Pseudomonas sp. 10S4 TaxID=3048583 RepID=UPI002AC92903|nr:MULTISPECIES: RNA 2',3'-cyclic phosphodiesterase [unclassified Pseudomonas]MEB0225073.1 RNA 2',3'-cyclic phosphodiesterase [Pseudomonas sp. 5S1]MEB0298544.1 RNA 2',3'-cyclic phosphodiesterase [Pseudomonas sp. 10S4]WPX16627.1 RNA 2',3'-cyclic phosphodiesterase [Pseudomonas sp. 10S4]